MLFSKRPLAGRRILITGASRGIGWSLATGLAAQRARVMLTARSEDQLRKRASDLSEQFATDVHFAAGDITAPSFRQRLLELCEQEFGGLDVLINNAGLGSLGDFATSDEARLRQIMEVNFFAPVELIRLCLPVLQRSQDPVIVNLGSVLGHCAVPGKSEYCASKFALHGMTDSLAIEFQQKGIDFLLVSPSTTRTEFFQNALRSNGKVAMNHFGMSPQQVAQATILAIQRRRREIILPASGKLLVYLNRFFPGALAWLLGKIAS